jgi:hypothetical protein
MGSRGRDRAGGARGASYKEGCDDAEDDQKQAQSSDQPSWHSGEAPDGQQRRHYSQDQYRYSPRQHTLFLDEA